jgi:hypothetical protein
MGEDRRYNVKELAEHTGNAGITQWSRGLLEKLTGLQKARNLPHFREPKCSLPHTQVPTSCIYPAPARSSPYPHIPFLEIHLTIILPSTPASPKWTLSLRFSHQNHVHASLLSHTSYIFRPSHTYRFHHPNNIMWGVQIIKLLIIQFSQLPCYLVPLRNAVATAILIYNEP